MATIFLCVLYLLKAIWRQANRQELNSISDIHFVDVDEGENRGGVTFGVRTVPDLVLNCMIPCTCSPCALSDDSYHSGECKQLRSYLLYLVLGMLFNSNNYSISFLEMLRYCWYSIKVCWDEIVYVCWQKF